ncbi:hypothetical protein NHX12_014422, partial [Muraenolepis orangiensis]
MGKLYQVIVYGINGEKMAVDLCNTDEQMQTMTVLQLKTKIVERLPGTGGGENLRLIFTNKQLDNDEATLVSFGIQNQSVIQLVMRECKLGEHPEVLVLLLKRFVFDYHCMEYVKNDSLVDVPLNIDVPEGLSYDLYATVDHYGNLRGGHYTATIRPPESVLGRWYKFDNSRVKELATFTPEKSSSAFLLHDRRNPRKGGRPTRPRPGEVPGSGEGDKKTGDTGAPLPLVGGPEGGGNQRKRSHRLDVFFQEEERKGDVDHGSSVELSELHAIQLSDDDGANEDDSGDEVHPKALQMKSLQCFWEEKGGRPTCPRPGEVGGSAPQVGGSTPQVGGSTPQVGGSTPQ